MEKQALIDKLNKDLVDEHAGRERHLKLREDTEVKKSALGSSSIWTSPSNRRRIKGQRSRTG